MTQAAPTTRANRRTSGRAQQDHIRDPYQAQKKLRGPTVCTECGAVYQRGRWQWGRAPDGAHRDTCPACRRIADRMPAGSVTLHGDFAKVHKAEIVGLMRNEEAQERQEHPLNRIVGISETDDGLSIETTDINLPHRLAAALKSAFHGELKMHFDEAGYFLRVDWTPPA
jgi:NMD protein affecting ribosome stability and mRNA decay